MRIIVCLDDKNGMLFGTRRQSKDRLLRQDLLQMTQNARLWMNTYSAGQFSEEAPQIRVAEDFLEKAGPGDWCFVENESVKPVADQVEQVVIYRWNRVYPATVRFPAELFSGKWKLTEHGDFPGSSHETITKEVYDL